MLQITLLLSLKGCVFRPAFGCAHILYFCILTKYRVGTSKHEYLITMVSFYMLNNCWGVGSMAIPCLAAPAALSVKTNL